MKKFLQKGKVLNRTIVTMLTMVMLFASMTTTALAAEPAVSEVASQENNGNEGIMPLASGYAAHYTTGNTGSFTISVTGSSLFSSFRVKAWSFSNSSDVYVSLYRPNGSAAFTNQKLTLEQLTTKTISNVTPGEWRLAYFIAGDGRGWINGEFR